MSLTRERIEELSERSKNDRAIIVGSEVRQLAQMALASLAPSAESELVMVPKEPTETMIAAAYPPSSEDAMDWDVVKIYRAMLSAAPKEET